MEKREPRKVRKDLPWCYEGWPDWRESYSRMEPFERDDIWEKPDIKNERAKQRTPYIMNIVGFSTFWNRLDKEADKEKQEKLAGHKSEKWTKNKPGFLEKICGAKTPTNRRWKLADEGQQRKLSVSSKKRNILQPVLSSLFSPSKRKFSNMESPF